MCEPLSFCQDKNGDIYHLFPMLWPSREYDVVSVYSRAHHPAMRDITRMSNKIDHNSHTIICDAFGLSEEKDGVAKYEVLLSSSRYSLSANYFATLPLSVQSLFSKFRTDYAPPWLTSWHKHTALNWAESLSLSDLSVLAMITTVMNRTRYDMKMLKAARQEQERKTMSVARRMAIEGMK